jgi:hypothetical protein
VLRFRQLSKRSINPAFDIVQLTSFTFDPYTGVNVKFVLDRRLG